MGPGMSFPVSIWKNKDYPGVQHYMFHGDEYFSFCYSCYQENYYTRFITGRLQCFVYLLWRVKKFRHDIQGDWQ